MAQSFRCRLITPESKVLDDEMVSVILPGWDGSLGVLPGRAPMVYQLGVGELRLDFADKGAAKGGHRTFFVAGGFAQMNSNTLTILAEHAEAAESISDADAKAQLAEAESRRTDGVLDQEKVEKIRLERERARARVRVAEAFRARGGGI